jgi:N-acetylgalactosamine-N,N'-diacetylbacillosaminyl-diphospho-undecaprenol 4-alpha-N-acetylgalactosaminyltransferase
VKRILFVINSLEGGGAERALSRLLVALSGDAWAADKEIHLVLLDDYEVEQVIPASVKVTTLSAQGSLLKSVTGLASVIRAIKPDAVVSYLTRANLAASVVCKLMRIPVIISERVNTTHHLTGRFAFIQKLMVRLLYPLPNRVVAVSGGVKEDLVQNFSVNERKCSVVYNGYDQSELNELSQESVASISDRPFAIAIGRLVPNKNVTMLLRAWRLAQPQCDLLILGEGPDRDMLQQEVDAYNEISDYKIRLEGFCKNPYPYIAKAQFYVSASNAEGFPNSLVEAMTLGVPVISTDCPSGPREILAPGLAKPVTSAVQAEWGLLTPTRNEEAMAAALSVFTIEEMRQQYARKAKERAQDFSMNAVKQGYIKLLNGTMK